MTVYYECIRSIGAQIKGEVNKVDNVKKIIDEKDKYVLWINEYFESYIGKNTYRIMGIAE